MPARYDGLTPPEIPEMNRAVVVVALAAGANAAALVASRGTAPPPTTGPRVALTDVRTEDWTGPGGKPVTMVYADWRNAGDRPVRRVTAEVVAVGTNGEVVFAAEGVGIYAAPAGSAGVGPGETFVEPAGRGVPLPGVADVAASAVEVTGIAE